MLETLPVGLELDSSRAGVAVAVGHPEPKPELEVWKTPATVLS